MNILIGHWGHEANTFSEHLASYEEYTGRGPTFGADSVRANDGAPSYLGGILRACKEEGAHVIPTCAYTAAAPTLSRDCAQRMLCSILSVCEEYKDEIDGVCLALHGAGVAEFTDDLESYVLRKIRAVLGDDIPITVPMDLHGNVSLEMASLADGLFGIRKYPHTDKEEASYLAAKTLCRMIREGKKVKTTVLHLPLLIPIAAGQTANAPFPELEEIFQKEIEKSHLIDAKLFHGFPYADVADSTASVVVVADRDAEKEARRLAKEVWKRRHHFRTDSLSPAQAMDLAEKVEGDGYLVINEMSDNPGGGCPGDGTHLLREMLRRNLPGSIFSYIVDPVAAEEISRHRPGDRMDVSLGGRHEAIFGEPLFLTDVEVVALSDGTFRHTSPNLLGLVSHMGKTARIRCKNVDIVVGSNRNQTFDDQPFAITGADLSQYRYVGLKSTQHFRSFFATRARGIFSCDPPGLNCGDLRVFEYKSIPRPVFPLDENASFDEEEKGL